MGFAVPPPRARVPNPGLKTGDSGQTPGVYESLLQAGEAENPKAGDARTGLEAKGNWGRAMLGRSAYSPLPSQIGREQLDRGVCVPVPSPQHSSRLPHPSKAAGSAPARESKLEPVGEPARAHQPRAAGTSRRDLGVPPA